jgi:aminocarboxymuconate-semialdehyde decarboxylase
VRIVDSHFHWWPRSIFELLCKLNGRSFPCAESDGKGGYHYWRRADTGSYHLHIWEEWFDLDRELEHMDKLGHEIDVVCSIGPFSVHFSDVPAEVGRDHALMWNEAMADAQRGYPGRLWASAAVPLQDTAVAIEVLDDAVGRLGLIGANLPGSIGADTRIDAERLDPFYARAAELDLPLFLHPTDAILPDLMDGYNGALHLTLGRIVEVDMAAARLVLSGLMERHPHLKIVMSHMGGSLPYLSGKMDKSGRPAGLPKPPSSYIKRLYTDTVQPESPAMSFGINYFGVDHIMYGSDYPCWNPAEALRIFHEVGLPDADRQKILNLNARRILNLRNPAESTAAAAE